MDDQDLVVVVEVAVPRRRNIMIMTLLLSSELQTEKAETNLVLVRIYLDFI